MKYSLTRRAMLAALPGGIAAAAVQTKRSRMPVAVGEAVRLIDPLTEAYLLRLTSLSSSSQLPASTNRAIGVKRGFLVFSSDREGRFAPYRLDLHNGTAHRLADTAKLDTSSLCLDSAERSVLMIDGDALLEVQIGNGRVRKLTDGVTAFSSGNSSSSLVVVRGGRLQHLDGRPIAENVHSRCLLAPEGDGCLFERSNEPGEREFWFAHVTSGPFEQPVLLAKGDVSFPFWSPDGRSVLFLRRIKRGEFFLPEIHKFSLDDRCEQRVCVTSQFAAFAPNHDASVFVGASSSKAQPNIMLLLRSPAREMTICEHHARDAVSVRPVFSPDSRRVYFESDREGKSALYSINVESLVEPTS